MEAILSHITALEVLRRWDSFKLIMQPTQGEDSCIPRRAPNSEQFVAISQLPALSGATLPIHVLVRDHGHRSYTDKVFSHAPLPYYPEGSFFSIAPGVACCGPELVTLQMVEYATNLELLLLVDELCSHYSVQPYASTGLVQRSEPLTTLSAIERYLEGLPGVRGTKRLRSVIKVAREQSGSPQESKACHQFEFPLARGGQAISVVGLNYPISVERAGAVFGESAARIRKPDLMILAPHSQADEGVSRGTRFEAVALDYQGAYHRDPFQESKDIDRRNELLACDVKDYEIAKEHFSDVSYLNWLASRIRRDMGMAEPQFNAQEQATYRKRSHELNEQLRSIDGLHWTARSKDLVMAGAHDFFGSAIPCKSISL